MPSFDLFYLGQAAYGLTLLAFCLRSPYFLRILAIAASVGFIAYSFLVSPAAPLWVPIGWHGLFIAANAFHLFSLKSLGVAARLDPVETFLAKTALANFPAHEVKAFVKIAAEGNSPTGQTIIKAGRELQYLFCVLQGGVEITKNGKKITEIRAGRFVGEMSLLTKSPTRADVTALEPSKFLVWPHADIDKWVEEDPTRLSLLQTALGTQVVEELLRQNEEMREAAEGVA